jgi:hypothetical protein
MQRILIGSALFILCAAVAAAQSPPGTTPGLPSPSGPGAIAPGAFAPGKLQRTSPPLTPQTVNPAIKTAPAPTAPARIAPAGVSAPGLQKQSLTLTNGTAFNATFDRGSNSFRTPLADGTYKLNNGGAIRVRGGEIIWDAFGVIDRLNAQKSKGQKVAEAPIGLG